ncbi:mevalonate kinase [Methanobacterium alkalithermotolerans]|uniref:Mevalonate kinase n=1 Tax=Methanobacterium alkalithermotolerans TaxID=2731220 RepID=A0A8T8K5T3_9EURY|nr:mevalonate kinase [Methanobacterium alkalithermotolerans]QUH23946.1 mevalonate kinase [Methanobacterium alkalithermotolerans]
MESKASAPGKAILFGEHAVVFGQPALAFAVDKRAYVSLKKSSGKKSTIKSTDLNFEASFDLSRGIDILKNQKKGIVNYILGALSLGHDGSPLEIELSMEMPVGAGMGSSAAVTVATLAAAYNLHHKNIDISNLAKKAHEVELMVQGAASPLDTAVSTNGGLVYLDENSEISSHQAYLDNSLILGYTSYRGNTGEMVDSVRKRRERFPQIMDPVIESVGNITRQALKLLSQDNLDKEYLGELMNINQGLLDSMGVNTPELSRMIFNARKYGALGSKITGAGGGGSIIAFCPGKLEEVLHILQKTDSAINADFSKEGVLIHHK